MSAKQLRLYYTERFKLLKGRFCPCGRPATKYKYDSFVCVRCDRIEGYVTIWHETAYRKQQQVLKERMESEEAISNVRHREFLDL